MSHCVWGPSAALALVLGLTGTVALAQEAGKGVALPPVVVETPKAPAAKKKKQAAAKPAPKLDAPAPAPQSGLGPVTGYVATQATSGTKTSTPLVEIPRSVSVITADQLTAQQPKSVRDIVSYVPGVQVQSGAGSVLDNIAVRGFAAPIYLNGLLLPTDTAIGFSKIRLEPYNLERLEILKGPASGLFGQSPPGGVINAISKRPQTTPSNEMYVQYGTDNHKEMGFDFTGPLGQANELSYRLVGVLRDTDLDFDFADRQRFFLAPSFTWRPDADTTLTVMGTAQRDSGFGPFQFVNLKLTQDSAPFGRVSRQRYFGEPGVDNYNEDQWTLGYEFEHRFSEALKFRQNVRYSDSTQDTVAIRAFGLENDRTVVRGLNALALDTQGIVVDNQMIADFVTGPLAHRLLVGLDYQNITAHSGFWVNNKACTDQAPTDCIPKIDAYNPVYGGPLPNPFASAPFVLADTSFQQAGVYMQDQIKYGGWRLTLGLRHDWANTELDDLRTDPSIKTPKHQEAEDEAWTGFAGLSYLFANGVAPYVNYSTSFLPVSGSSLVNGTTLQALKPTTGEGYEAGVKYQPPGTNTLFTAAIFQITQQNVTSSAPDPQGGAPIVTQTGEVRMRGFELEAKTRIGANFDLIAGYGYLEPIITGDITFDGGKTSVVGNDFQQLSRHTGSLWGVYTWRHGPLAGLSLGAGVRYVGTQWAEAANDNRLPAYTLVDGLVSYDLGQLSPGLAGAKLQLNAYNLFDEYYVATCQGQAFCQLGESRTVLATLKYNW